VLDGLHGGPFAAGAGADDHHVVLIAGHEEDCRARDAAALPRWD
jgi:hypothetical protein